MVCTMAFALLIGNFAGLVLPVAAESYVSVLDGFVEESYTFPAGTKDKEVMKGVTLEASTDYVFRFIAGGAAGDVAFVLNGAWYHVDVVESEQERIYQTAITTGTTDLDKTSVYVTVSGETDMNVRALELYKAPADGEFNLLPGGDCSMESTAFSNFYAKGATIEVDPDNADNTVMSIPGNVVDLNPNFYAGNHMLIKLSFRYKGSMRFDDWMGSSGCFPGYEGAASVSGEGGTFNGKATPKYVTFTSKDKWAKGSIVIRRAGGQDAYFYMRNLSATPLLLDDIKITKVPAATGIALNKQELKIYPGNYDQLSYSTVPAMAFLPVAWAWM